MLGIERVIKLCSGHAAPGITFLLGGMWQFMLNPKSHRRSMLPGGHITALLGLGSFIAAAFPLVVENNDSFVHNIQHALMVAGFCLAFAVAVAERHGVLIQGGFDLMLGIALVQESLLILSHAGKSKVEDTCHTWIGVTSFASGLCFLRNAMEPGKKESVEMGDVPWALIGGQFCMSLHGVLFIATGFWLPFGFRDRGYGWGPSSHGKDFSTHADTMNTTSILCAGVLILAAVFIVRLGLSGRPEVRYSIASCREVGYEVPCDPIGKGASTSVDSRNGSTGV
mmetsp:Transcript_53466/g.171326  ORF Transcript_53466/g.171326 Transcript_53466/m.171326 type:complete len:282 (-) Transcript_53466:68-913(-)